MNTGKELFTESIDKENYSYMQQCSLARTNDNTSVGPTTCKYKCFLSVDYVI